MSKFDVKQFGKVAVLMGGGPSEREVSLMSGNEVLKALRKNGVDAYAVDVEKDFKKQLATENYDRTFLALHGEFGEDGTIQGYLETIGLPYTGSGVAASAFAMDKYRAKLIFQAFGIPTPPFVRYHDELSTEEIISQLGLPLAIKPINRGSSVGITKVVNHDQFQKAIELAKSFDDEIMIEPWYEGEEYTVGILGEAALPSIRIATPVGFYDYEAKYFSDETEYYCPSGLDGEQEELIKDISLRAYNILGCKDWGRVDLIKDSKGNFSVLEVNTLPGLTSHSLVPKAARAVGLEFDALVLEILAKSL